MSSQVILADCLDWMRGQPDNSVDLVFTSPPYESAREYGELKFSLKGQDWVDWAAARFVECVRICRGMVCWVVEGQTRKFRWSATPALLMADLHRAGVHLRKPPAFCRVGIPGSGGPDWVRNDWEFVICGSKGGKLPWSDNTACGHPPKYAPGGAMSNRKTNGQRMNRPSHRERKVRGSYRTGGRSITIGIGDGRVEQQQYIPPALANPGNLIRAEVGGGIMGSRLCHENEAPFPEKLAEFFIRSFCPPGGVVLDPFSGSGTTGAVAVRLGRQYIGIECRESQAELTRRRLAEVQLELVA